MEEMVAVANAIQPLTPESEARLARAMATTMIDDEGPGFEEAVAKRDTLLALV
jgi:beta-N-acetylhexosaminidase